MFPAILTYSTMAFITLMVLVNHPKLKGNGSRYRNDYFYADLSDGSVYLIKIFGTLFWPFSLLVFLYYCFKSAAADFSRIVEAREPKPAKETRKRTVEDDVLI